MHSYAQHLLDVRSESKQIPPLSNDAALSLADGYEIAKAILDIRLAQGETMVGRKIGFTNRTVWPKFGPAYPIERPIWAPVFDTTVRYAEQNHGVQSLVGAVQPRIEPEIVFKLGSAPAPDATFDDIAGCIEWMAHGFEIVVCPFPGWKLNPPDAIAAFGLHGTLIVGEPKILSESCRRNLAVMLANASVSLSVSAGDSFTLRAAGFGSNVLDSPVHALWHLHQVLLSQPQFPPLAAGEIISTGTLTDAYPIEPGQTWTTAFLGVPLPGLTVSFV